MPPAVRGSCIEVQKQPANCSGMLGGHDILDSTLMVFLISGTYLACGKTIPPVSDGPATSRMTSHHGRPILLNLTPVWRCRPLR
ncbi:MAG: hypothetical protein EOR71_13770 [Mesorhizobium sp.]|nr:MAG: hypothetical protein EOR71_13770 [Mesorhizobium sp.]